MNNESKEIKNFFYLYDKNKNGYIEKIELKNSE